MTGLETGTRGTVKSSCCAFFFSGIQKAFNRHCFIWQGPRAAVAIGSLTQSSHRCAHSISVILLAAGCGRQRYRDT